MDTAIPLRTPRRPAGARPAGRGPVPVRRNCAPTEPDGGVGGVGARLAVAAVTVAAVALFLFGSAWDVQWHLAVGRDRVLTAPHLLMLGGIALAGTVCLAAVLVE